MSTKYPAVSSAVATVMTPCTRMMTSKPSMPLPKMITMITANATIFAALAFPQPRRPMMVAVARVAMATKTISKPTSTI